MKSKIIKSMMGLACLLAVDATPATDEGLIEETVATCKDGNCNKSKDEGFHFGGALGCSRSSNRMFLKEEVAHTGLSIGNPNASLGGSKSVFVADLRVDWTAVLTGECFFVVEGGVDLGGNVKVDYKEDCSYFDAATNAMANAHYEGKVTRKGVVPWLALGLKLRHCPTGIVCSFKGGISYVKLDFEFMEGDKTFFPNEIKFSKSQVRPFIAFGVEKKFGRIGGFVEVRHVFPGRVDQTSVANTFAGDYSYKWEGKQKETSVKVGAMFGL